MKKEAAIIGVISLLLASMTWAANEDFSDSSYIGVDPDGVVDKGATDSGAVIGTGVNWHGTDTYVYRDYGAGAFGTSYTHKMEIVFSNGSSASQYFSVLPYVLSNEIDDFYALYSGTDEGDDAVVVRIHIGNYLTFTMSLEIYEDGSVVDSDSIDISSYAGQRLYITIHRTSGTAWSWTVGTSGIDSTNLVNGNTITGTESNTFRYYYPLCSYNQGYTDIANLTVDNVELGDGGEPPDEQDDTHPSSPSIGSGMRPGIGGGL